MLLNIKVAHQLGMLLNKLAARLYLVTHEDGKQLVCCLRILHAHLQHGTPLRVHGGIPQLLRVHLAQALVALDDGTVPAHLVQLGSQLIIAVGVT